MLLNILSNAMDATEKLKQKKRVISLEISPTQGGYAINCMNTYRNRPTFNQGRIISSKEDTENHGKGISIIKSIVEKHGGAMKIMIHDDMKIFELNCFIPRLVQGGSSMRDKSYQVLVCDDDEISLGVNQKYIELYAKKLKRSFECVSFMEYTKELQVI